MIRVAGSRSGLIPDDRTVTTPSYWGKILRITKVYTKTGDAGQTSLVGGDRVSKADLRVSAYGDVDELNSTLGVARTGTQVPRVDEEMVGGLEREIDRHLEELEPLKEFILPGGSQAGAMLHLARTVARRAERAVVALAEREEINPAALRYLNRLSDLLFVLARVASRRAGTVEQPAQFSSRGKRKPTAK